MRKIIISMYEVEWLISRKKCKGSTTATKKTKFTIEMETNFQYPHQLDMSDEHY